MLPCPATATSAAEQMASCPSQLLYMCTKASAAPSQMQNGSHPFSARQQVLFWGILSEINVPPLLLLGLHATASPQDSSPDSSHFPPLAISPNVAAVQSHFYLHLSCSSHALCLCSCFASVPSTHVHSVPLPLVGFPVWFSRQFSPDSALSTLFFKNYLSLAQHSMSFPNLPLRIIQTSNQC